jgi:uncharacterized protein YndB with AHSA1/START domain
MKAGKNPPVFSKPSDREIVMTRIIDAPREFVWKACTDPDTIPKWWAPKSTLVTVDKMEVKPGGVWRFLVRGPDGEDYAFSGVYREKVPPERLVYTSGFEDAPEDAVLETLTFEELDGKTKLTVTSLFPTAEDRDWVITSEGEKAGAEAWDRLEEHLEGMTAVGQGAIRTDAENAEDYEFTIVRVLEAPRETVWKAWTESERLAQWWGPRGYRMLIRKMDLSPGGVLHYCIQAPEGRSGFRDTWSKLVYREILPPERLAFVSAFSDEAGASTRHPFDPKWPVEVLNVVTFSERQGKTLVTLKATAFNATEAERVAFMKGRGLMLQEFICTFDWLMKYLKDKSA